MIASIREKNISKKEDIKRFKCEHRGSNAHLPDNQSQDQFQQSSLFKDFCARSEVLGSPQKKCLSSFILFPVNTELKKTLLTNWWLVQGFLDDLKKQGRAVEDIATEIVDDLTANNFILPVCKHCQKIANSFKMQPDVHIAVITLAKEYKSKASRSYGNTFSWYDEWGSLINSKSMELDNDHQEKVETFFNVSQGSLDCTMEPFSKKRNVKVLYLGMWQSSAENHHIEVAGTQFFKGLKNMENLRFPSLQGISGIQELPSSISYLEILDILDARSCYHQHKLPREIGSLRKLTHLDISECYLLDYMPKELILLSELQVFKGFVDSNNVDRCTLVEFGNLKKLRKLSVTVNSETFSTEEFPEVYSFKQLLKLKIIWGGKLSRVMQNKNSKQASKEAKSKGMNLDKKKSSKVQESDKKNKRSKAHERGVDEVIWEKLELQCLPHKTILKWVNPDKLTRLKKLYIRGGELRSLARMQKVNKKWNVEALRLKYLDDFKMDWRELRALFPELQYLEKFKCPKLTLFPCDCYGVWSSR